MWLTCVSAPIGYIPHEIPSTVVLTVPYALVILPTVPNGEGSTLSNRDSTIEVVGLQYSQLAHQQL